MGLLSEDDINQAAIAIKEITPERKKQLIFLNGFERGWKDSKHFCQKDSKYYVKNMLNSSIPSLIKQFPDWKNKILEDDNQLDYYGTMVGYLIGIMRFDPIGIIRSENIDQSIEAVKQLASADVSGVKIKTMITKMLKNHWMPEIKSKLKELSSEEKQNYNRFIKSI